MPANKETVTKLKSLSTSDLVILRWHLKRRPSQTPPDPISTIYWLLGGRGCVAAETPIWDPVNHEYRPIEKMTEPGWVLTTQGPAIASPSYIKGVAPLYRVETETGDVILTTTEHRFLTKRGYIPLREIETGDEILSLDPSKLLEDDLHLRGKDPSSLYDYHLPPRLYDQPLHSYQVNAQGKLPLRAGVLERNPYSFCLDDSTPSQECNLRHLEPDHHSRSGFSLDEPSLEVDQLPPELLADERFQQRLQETVRFLQSTYPQIDSNLYGDFSSWLLINVAVAGESSYFPVGEHPYHAVPSVQNYEGSRSIVQFPLYRDRLDTFELPFQVRYAFDALLEASFSPFVVDSVGRDSVWSKIVSVTFAGTQEFYDLHVPGPNNYLAAGMFHSNSGKTYSAANHIYCYSAELPWVEENDIVFVALIGSIYDDVKNTLIEGKSGLLKIIPEEDLLKWNRTNGELSWRVVGPEGQMREVRANAYTSEKPDKLRGPNIHLAWLDEYAKFKDANEDPTKAGTTWNNMMLGLRLGTKPHVIVTGTPTDCRLSKYLLAHPSMKMSLMTTWDNRDNLPESYFDEIKLMDPNSRTYRQEILAELIFDNPDAIFSEENIDLFRANVPEDAEIVYKVLGYDPSVSSAAEADECGIILSAYTPEVKEKTGDLGGRPRVVKPTHAYVLRDLSGHYTPKEQTELVIQTVLNEGVSDLVFEQNQGVEFIMQALEQSLKDNTLEYHIRKLPKAKKTDYGIVKRWQINGVDSNGMNFKFIIYAVHATSQKKLRAEMVSTRYDSGQIHHPLRENPLPICPIQNCRANLEHQMVSWDPKSSRYSPDRLDAMAYCMLHIFANFMITRSKVTISRPPGVTQATSQHQAVNPRRRGAAGIYGVDADNSAPGDMAERNLIPYLESENMRGRNPYS